MVRRIIKQLHKDKLFAKNYIETGLVPKSRITVNYIIKILKRKEVIFENVNKEIVQELLAFNEDNITHQQSKSFNFINTCFNQNSNQKPIKENHENKLRFNFVQMRNINDKPNKENYFNKTNSQNYFSESSQNSDSNSNYKKMGKVFINSGSTQEKSKTDFLNEITISETSCRGKNKQSGSDLIFQKELFDKEMDFLNKGKMGKNLEKGEKENLNDSIFSFLNENEEDMHACFSYISL
jgi:hypothetical protein